MHALAEGARGALALLAGAASSLSSGVLGLARSAGSQVLAGPRALTSSIRSFVLNPLSLGWPPEAESTGGGTSAAGAACFDALPPAASAAAAAPVAHAFRDDPRVVTCCVAAPVGCMLAAADNLGRVLLANGATMTVLHMWKGYRDAQVGWLEVRQERAAAAATAAAEAAAQCASFGDDTSPRPSNAAAETETTPKEQRPLAGGKGRKGKGGQAGGDRPAPAARSSPAVTTSGGGGAAHVALLAVYAPKRQTLDVWEPCSGRLLATRLVGPNAQLLPTQLPLGASAADGLLEDCLGRLPTSCFVLEAGTGRLTDVADLLPALPAAAPKGSGGGGTGGE